MKNYKRIVPIIIIVIFALSFYKLYDAKSTKTKEYNGYLQSARDYYKQDIRVDAEENYINALNMNPSVDLYLEIGEFYKNSDNKRDAVDWGEIFLDKYPAEVEPYEYMIELLVNDEDYIYAFELYDTMTKRNLKSKGVEKIIGKIEYEFFFNGEFQDVGIFSEGLCPVYNKGYWGYANEGGNLVTEYEFLKAGNHFSKLAPVVDSENQAYFVDESGNKKRIVQNVKNVKELGLINEGLYPLYNGKTWGLYNEKDEFAFGEYDDVSTIAGGFMAVKKNNKWSLVDTKGNAIGKNTYDNVAMDEKKVVCRNERLFVYYDLCYHLVDSTGKQISNQTFEDAKVFYDTTYAAVKINGKWGFIDKEGKIVIEPQYEDARSFSNGLAAVKYAGKWGFINDKGEIVIECQFQSAKDFNSSGSAYVQDGEYWTLLKLYKYNF